MSASESVEFQHMALPEGTCLFPKEAASLGNVSLDKLTSDVRTLMYREETGEAKYYERNSIFTTDPNCYAPTHGEAL